MPAPSPNQPANGGEGLEEVGKLREEVSNYIRCKEAEGVGDSEAVCLLCRVFTTFMKEAETVNNIAPASLQGTLKVIKERLCRIEEKGKLKSKTGSYAEIAATGRNPGAAWVQEGHHQKRTPKNALLKKRRVRELVIKITDDKNKEEMERKIIKDLAEALRVKCDAVTGINRLASEDIRVFTRSQEVKEALQKNIEWSAGTPYMGFESRPSTWPIKIRP